MLASHVLLHIRAEAGENPGLADGLTKLTQINFQRSETECNQSLNNDQHSLHRTQKQN